MKKRLPIGVQDFPKLIREDYIYVDKTEILYKLIQGGDYYFLSRPRRFGKSLLVSTLKEIFEGNRELFNGLWIEDQHDWEPRPVILLDFTRISKRAYELEKGIELELREIGDSYGIKLKEETNAGRFQELIKAVSRERQVAILVDEYDKPILDNIDDEKIATANRESLKDLYSVVKGNDDLISFFFLTGVSKFSHVSIFSDLNNLFDITIGSEFATLLGYTESELRSSFKEYLDELQVKYIDHYPNIVEQVRKWYNGYSWDGTNFVFNPFSILNLLRKQLFQDYWFSSGTPTFLIRLIRRNQYSIFDFKDIRINVNYFNKFEVGDMEINSLLFQTGYLTMRAFDPISNIVTLGFPNREVEESFNIHLLADFSGRSKEEAGSILYRLGRSLENGAVEDVIGSIKAMFSELVFPLIPGKSASLEKKEAYYHSIFYLVLKLLGYNIQAEVMTSRGRIDAVITTENYVYVVEFKIGDAASALSQIKSLGYHQTPITIGDLNAQQKVLLLGIGFDTELRNIGEYLVEEAAE